MAFGFRTVLEVGSGLGLTGLVACKACRPKEFFFSDCHEDVLELLVENVKRNMSSSLSHDDTNAASLTASNETCLHTDTANREYFYGDDLLLGTTFEHRRRSFLTTPENYQNIDSSDNYSRKQLMTRCEDCSKHQHQETDSQLEEPIASCSQSDVDIVWKQEQSCCSWFKCTNKSTVTILNLNWQEVTEDILSEIGRWIDLIIAAGKYLSGKFWTVHFLPLIVFAVIRVNHTSDFFQF